MKIWTLIAAIISCSMVSFVARSDVFEDTTDDFRFYMAKSVIKEQLVATTKDVGFTGTDADFGAELEKRLMRVRANFPGMDYTVLTSMQDTAKIIITLVGFEGEKGFIGWKFDTVLVDNAAYFFSITLPDRKIPELKPEDYYQWHRMRSE